jgi:hypothetical protein
MGVALGMYALTTTRAAYRWMGVLQEFAKHRRDTMERKNKPPGNAQYMEAHHVTRIALQG